MIGNTNEIGSPSYLLPFNPHALEQLNQPTQVIPVNQHDNDNDNHELIEHVIDFPEELQGLLESVTELEEVITSQDFRARTLEAIQLVSRLAKRVQQMGQESDDDDDNLYEGNSSDESLVESLD